MLMHDFDQIVDMLMHNRSVFQPSPKASFLENINGQLTEKDIGLEDIKTFIQIAYENICELDADINKMIYLRRLYEITKQKHMGYELLSNLFKKREMPIVLLENRDMTIDEVANGESRIREYIPDNNIVTILFKINGKVFCQIKTKAMEFEA